MDLLDAAGAGAEEVEENFGARLAGADDGDVVGLQEFFAVVEVVGGVDDGDAGGFCEGAQGFGDEGCGADSEGDVAGVGVAL